MARPADQMPAGKRASRMHEIRIAVAIIFASLALSGCGDHLGTYKVEDVQLVREVPREPNTFDDAANRARAHDGFLRIEISSKFNLNTAKTGPGLYTQASSCPFKDAWRFIAFGPRASDGFAVENWQRSGQFLPSKTDGRYHYFVYLVPQSPPRKPHPNATEVIPGYNLQTGSQGVCLRFFVPGYNITASASDIIEVPQQAIAKSFVDPSSGRPQ